MLCVYPTGQSACESFAIGQCNMCSLHLVQTLMDIETVAAEPISKSVPSEVLEKTDKPNNENMLQAEFVGTGLRPPGRYVMQNETEKLEIPSPVMISGIHKFIRRDDSSNLKGILHCGLLALENREKTSGIKSVITQFKHRVFLTLMEEGVAIFPEPEISEVLVDCAIGMFNSGNLESKISNCHKLCDTMSGLYRGRIISGLMSWCRCDSDLLNKLDLPEPPDIQFGDAMSLNLSTQRDKLRMKQLVIALGESQKAVNWILKIIPEVNHQEFNRMLILSAILSNEKFHEKLPKVQPCTTTDTRLPTIEYMRQIGVYDCHTGRGNFDDFLDKGMRVSNMAPVTIHGKSLEDLEEIYLKIKKATGSKRFPNRNKK